MNTFLSTRRTSCISCIAHRTLNRVDWTTNYSARSFVQISSTAKLLLIWNDFSDIESMCFECRLSLWFLFIFSSFNVSTLAKRKNSSRKTNKKQLKYIKPTDIAYRLYFLPVGEMRVMNFQSWITLDLYKNGIEIEKCNNSYIDDWMWMDNSSIHCRWIRNHSNAKMKSAHPIHSKRGEG